MQRPMSNSLLKYLSLEMIVIDMGVSFKTFRIIIYQEESTTQQQ